MHRNALRLAGACLLASTLIACSQDEGKSDTMRDRDTAAIGKAAFEAQRSVQAPAAERRMETFTQHGETREDPYHWLRDDNWQQVLREPSVLKAEIRDHLLAENDYHAAMMSDVAGLQDTLFEEMRGRIKEDDSSVPTRDGDWEYYVRYREGGDYPVYARRPVEGGEEVILFDGDAESEGHDFFNIASVVHSPDHRLIAYGLDTVGSEYFTIRVRNIETGEAYSDAIESTDGRAVWAADSDSFFYVERDDNQRPRWVRHHELGSDADEDRLVYEEDDSGMFISLGKTQSGDYILIGSGNHTRSQSWYIPADAADSEPTLIAPRKDDELYSVEHHGDHFYILTNADDAVDFKIVRAPVASPGRDNWEDWLAHEPGRLISSFVTYQDHLVYLARRNAVPILVVSDYDGDAYEVPMDDEAYSLGLISGYEFDTELTRFSYSTPAQPAQTFDWQMSERERTLRKTQEVPSGHNPDHYVVERIDAETEDGVKVPVTILRLKSTPLDGSAPLLLYGYGSYGAYMPDNFSVANLSLVDRGVIRAVAKVRGGTALGRQWYLDGKMEAKPNSFTDFLASAHALIEHGYTSKGRIVIDGRSAGGLLVGATLNLDPEVFGGAIAGVPFVDVLNTISDPSLPLTPPEWPEWGNPIESKAHYQLIKGYSPYDNLRDDVPYPPIMATAGLADYRVTYWEPAKWIARLRAEAKGGPFLLKTNMDAGHAGSAARFDSLRETAELYSFALKVMGRGDAEPVRQE
jgi:oligopeptidase B